MTKTKNKRKRWTVVGFYTDNAQPWVDWTTAETIEEAVTITVSRRDTDDVAVVEVFEGHRKGCLKNDEVLYHRGLQALKGVT